MQHGGCHPNPAAADRDAARTGASAARTSTSWPPTSCRKDNGRTLFPAYEIRKFHGVKIGFIGMTLEGTPSIVAPSGITNLEFLDEADTANRYARSCAAGTTSRRSWCCCTRAARRTRSPRRSASTTARDFDKSEPDRRHRQPHDRRGRPVRHRPHAPAVHLRDRRPAGHQRVVDRPPDHRHRPRDRPPQRGRRAGRRSTTRSSRRDVAQDAADMTSAARHATRSSPRRSPTCPSARSRPTSCRDAAPRAADAAGEQPLGNLIADAQLADTDDADRGDADLALMNPGGVRADLTFDSPRRHGRAGDLRRGLRGPAVRQHRHDVSRSRAPQLLDVLKDQWCDNPAAGPTDPAAVEQLTYTYDQSGARRDIGRTTLRGRAEPGVERDGQRRRDRPRGDLPRDDEQLPRRRRGLVRVAAAGTNRTRSAATSTSTRSSATSSRRSRARRSRRPAPTASRIVP